MLKYMQVENPFAVLKQGKMNTNKSTNITKRKILTFDNQKISITDERFQGNYRKR